DRARDVAVPGGHRDRGGVHRQVGELAARRWRQAAERGERTRDRVGDERPGQQRHAATIGFPLVVINRGAHPPRWRRDSRSLNFCTMPEALRGSSSTTTSEVGFL